LKVTLYSKQTLEKKITKNHEEIAFIAGSIVAMRGWELKYLPHWPKEKEEKTRF